MAVPRPTPAADDLTAARREAARWRTRTRDAEHAAAESDHLLDTVLDLIADRVIEEIRERGWIEFHRTPPPGTALASGPDKKGPRLVGIPSDQQQATHHQPQRKDSNP